MIQTLQALGAQVKSYIPDQTDEDYSLNTEVITGLAQTGARTLITVGGGIRSLNEIVAARDCGMTTIVTDHHHVGTVLPQAHAVIDPHHPDCVYPFKDLAGVGVAYKLAQALLRANRQAPLPLTQFALGETDLLDLVALGTVADMVPLLGENRMLVLKGLAALNEVCRPGLHALLKLSGIAPGTVTAKSVAHLLAPRAREATIFLQLLLTFDVQTARSLVQELNSPNDEWLSLVLEVTRACARESPTHSEIPPLLFVTSPDFPHEYIGLAATYLRDEFHRPAVFVSIEGERSKGTACSIPGFHITEALDTLNDIIEGHSGHSLAAKFTVPTYRLPEMEASLLALANKQLTELTHVPMLQVDAEIPLETLSLDLYHAIERLEPFGCGNSTPILTSRNVQVLESHATDTEGHRLKLCLADKRGVVWDAVAFQQEDWLDCMPRRIDIAYTLEVYSRDSQTNLRLNIQDIHFPEQK